VTAQTFAGEAASGRRGLGYDGRRFRPAGHPPAVESPAGRPPGVEPPAGHLSGVEPPVGHYHQDGDLVWAEFSGGTVVAGRLVGRCRPDGAIESAYCMLTASGETVAGACLSVPTVLADGRVRLAEHWRRLDGSSGVSHVEQIEDEESTA